MSVTLTVSREALTDLQSLLDANPKIDWHTTALDDPRVLDGLDWGAAGARRDALVPLLMAYQRLARILPAAEERRASKVGTREAGYGGLRRATGTPLRSK
jgi:hypothetical protein